LGAFELNVDFDSALGSGQTLEVDGLQPGFRASDSLEARFF
jgi:hypothetical protein